MRNIVLFHVLLALLFCSCGISKKASSNKEENKYFKISVEQNDKILPLKNNIIELEKSPFKFKIELRKTDDIFVSASWDRYYYDYPTEENIFACEDLNNLEECRFISIKTGNQTKFNVNKELPVGDSSYQWSWFYYENKDWHRLDKDIRIDNDITYANFTVENIYDCDKRDSRKYEKNQYNYPINKIDDVIYMVFATEEYIPGNPPPKELQRVKFILKFK